jgi:hypothetical protein
MGMDWVLLADLGDDAEGICDRLLDVAAVVRDRDDLEDDDWHQDDAKALPWHVRLSRKLLGTEGTWKP